MLRCRQLKQSTDNEDFIGMRITAQMFMHFLSTHKYYAATYWRRDRRTPIDWNPTHCSFDCAVQAQLRDPLEIGCYVYQFPTLQPVVPIEVPPLD